MADKMFEKYNDNPAAICIGIYLIGSIFYVFQLLFMTEIWLAGEGIGPEAIPVARVLGSAFIGFIIGMVLTYINGPDGQKIYFFGQLTGTKSSRLPLFIHQSRLGKLKAGQRPCPFIRRKL